MLPFEVHSLLAEADALVDPLSLRNKVYAKLHRDHCARLLQPLFTEIVCDSRPLGDHTDPFVSHLIPRCDSVGLKVSCGIVKYSTWQTDTEKYEEQEGSMIRVMDLELGYQLDGVAEDGNSMFRILMISLIGSEEKKAVPARGFYACKRFVKKLKQAFFDEDWPEAVVKGSLVRGLQGTVKGATQLAVYSKGKQTSAQHHEECDWRNSTKSKWSSLERFEGQNRLCVFWRLQGFACLEDDQDGYPILTLINDKALKLIDAEDRKEIENRVREQQELIHRKTYENTIRRQSSSQPNTC